ncbi:unnamed protein product [Clonostachys rosea]|uniref:F-box domain-containing protein n=1 Tax=Bionectria ochroleuca TaxID=29856 RepID=A0ABY6UFV7_BIOOC|nr:unnamed protein product [Clonostachys rosea]
MPSSSEIAAEVPGTDFRHPQRRLQLLPIELIERVAEYVSEDLVIPTAKDLLFLSLTCKRVFPVAIRLLYEFNERMVISHCANAEFWWCEPVPYCKKHKGKHRHALEWACTRGGQGTLEAVIAISPKLCNCSHVRGAIKSKQYGIARRLLRQKRVVNQLKAGIQQNSPIFEAVASGHRQLINRIIKIQGVDFAKVDVHGMSVLDHACRNGHWGRVRRFMNQGAIPYLDTMISLRQATHCKDAEVLYTLIQGILTLRPDERFVETTRYIVILNDRSDILEILLEKGIIDQVFEGPPGHLGDLFDNAIAHASMAVYRKLLGIYPTNLMTERWILDKLARTACHGHQDKAIQQIQWLLDHVRLVSDIDLSFLTYENLRSILSTYIDRNAVLLVDYILSLFGRLQVGQTPSYAQDRKIRDGPRSIEMLQVLRKYGFDINQIADRETILQRSIVGLVDYGGNPEVVKYLASEVRNINQYNDYKAAALHTWLCSLKGVWSMRENDVLTLTDYFLNNEASLSIKNARGNTPLHLAAANTSHASVIQLLLDRGADANARNNAGETPLQYAERLLGSTNTSDEAQKVLRLLARWTSKHASGWGVAWQAIFFNIQKRFTTILGQDKRV